MTLVLGFGYPLVVTGLSQLFFHQQANGSLLYRDGKLVGSALLGQAFTDSKGNPLPQYFQPRPSAAGAGYDASSSGASNLGPSNPLLIGFVPGVNTVGLDGSPSAANPFATKADPACVPTDPEGNPVTSPAPGQKYAKASDGSYVCDPNTIPERAIAYRAFNGLAANAPVPGRRGDGLGLRARSGYLGAERAGSGAAGGPGPPSGRRRGDRPRAPLHAGPPVGLPRRTHR